MSALDLSKREIPILPGEINDFVSDPGYFKVVIAQSCKTQLLQNFTSFKKLQILDLTNNDLGAFVKTNTLSGMFLLKALVLKKNGIVSFSDNFFSTTKNIEMLDVSENKIIKCSKAFLDLQRLITLNLNKNCISDLSAFKIFKNNQLIDLQYLGIKQNNIESNYQTKFESALTMFFPNLNFVLTIFSQQKDLHAFNEILYLDYYLSNEIAPQIIQQECSFHNESLALNQFQTSAKKSRKSVNSCDSRFGSFKKRDIESLKKQIEFRKRELQKIDSSIEQLNWKKDELNIINSRFQLFLQESLQLQDGTILFEVIKKIGEHCNSIDFFNQQKGRNLVLELLHSMKYKDSMDIDQTLMKMEAIMSKMQELMTQ